MSDTPPLGFERFLERHADDFPRISRASKGEWQADAVRGEAWLLAFDIGQKLGRPLDLERDDDASLLVRWLYNHCVKYCETVVRRAVRLDHAAEDDEDGQPHWLMGRLTADEGHHPLSLLEAAESARAEPDAPDAYHSSAAAWLQLLQRFDRRMPDVAAYLMISLSWCYACCRHAHDLARAQWPLPHGLSIEEDQDALRPWRVFKLPSAMPGDDPRQLALHYWTCPSQPASGQLWLL